MLVYILLVEGGESTCVEGWRLALVGLPEVLALVERPLRRGAVLDMGVVCVAHSDILFVIVFSCQWFGVVRCSVLLLFYTSLSYR